jgi:hypothetical protein
MRRGTTFGRPWQIDREVERDFAVLNLQHSVSESYRLSDVVGVEDGGEALVMSHRSLATRVKASRAA